MNTAFGFDYSSALAKQALRNHDATIEIKGRVDLCDPDEIDIRTLAVLRDLMSFRVKPIWHLICPTDLDLRPFYFIFPPQSINGKQFSASEWMSEFRYGLLYWRKGPGFVSVRDGRDNSVTEATLTAGTFLDAFRLAQYGCCEDTLDLVRVKPLVDDKIIERIGSHLLVLPYRMIYWPIPCNVI